MSPRLTAVPGSEGHGGVSPSPSPQSIPATGGKNRGGTRAGAERGHPCGRSACPCHGE